MRLSTRTRYGTRAMLELARTYEDGPLTIAAIAERQGLSVKYLEQIMPSLKSSGLVRGVRGASGGYVLARPPERIKMSECYTSLEGPTTTTDCVLKSDICARADGCAARSLWCDVHNAIMSVLDSITLQNLSDRDRCGDWDYHI